MPNNYCAVTAAKRERTLRQWASAVIILLLIVIGGYQAYRLTALQKLANSLSQREQHLAAFVPVALIVCDDQGVITLCNTVAVDTFGYADTELLGHSIDKLIPEDHVVSHHVAFSRAVAEMRATPGDCQIFWHRETAIMSRGGKLQPIGLAVRGIKLDSRIEFIAAVSPLTTQSDAGETRIKPLDSTQLQNTLRSTGSK